MEAQRNIVPLRFEGFDFATPSIANQLTGKLSRLKQYHALLVLAEFFFEAMDRLRQQFLNLPLDAVLHPTSPSARQVAEVQAAAAVAAPAVGSEVLAAQEWFEKGFDAGDINEKIRCYSEAIRLSPNFHEAYHNRGVLFEAKGDLDGALRDYGQATGGKPDYADAFYKRALLFHAKGDLDSAVKDFGQAICAKPDDAAAYFNRGNAFRAKGDPESAKAAIADFQKYLDLGGGVRDGDQAVVEGFIPDLKAKL